MIEGSGSVPRTNGSDWLQGVELTALTQEKGCKEEDPFAGNVRNSGDGIVHCTVHFDIHKLASMTVCTNFPS